MNKRFVAPLSVKSASEGSITCVFATTQTWDKHNDWTQKGAFGAQEKILLEGWNHDYSLPVGQGRIFERGNEAIFEGKFFMNTQNGRDHFEVVRQTMPEFSYTFEIVSSTPAKNAGRAGRRLKKLAVLGVSAVSRAAGENTRVLAMKSRAGRNLAGRDLTAEIAALGEWIMHNDFADLRAMLAKGKAPSAQQMHDDIWVVAQVAAGHNPEYAEFVLAARREAARQAALDPDAYHFVASYPQVRG